MIWKWIVTPVTAITEVLFVLVPYVKEERTDPGKLEPDPEKNIKTAPMRKLIGKMPFDKITRTDPNKVKLLIRVTDHAKLLELLKLFLWQFQASRDSLNRLKGRIPLWITPITIVCAALAYSTRDAFKQCDNPGLPWFIAACVCGVFCLLSIAIAELVTSSESVNDIYDNYVFHLPEDSDERITEFYQKYILQLAISEKACNAIFVKRMKWFRKVQCYFILTLVLFAFGFISQHFPSRWNVPCYLVALLVVFFILCHAIGRRKQRPEE